MLIRFFGFKQLDGLTWVKMERVGDMIGLRIIVIVVVLIILKFLLWLRKKKLSTLQ